MADVLVFPSRGAALAQPAPDTFDRARYRANLETAIAFLFDQGDKLIAILNRMDGDPDFEPGADDEETGDNEPDLAALVSAISQTHWTGFDHGGAA